MTEWLRDYNSEERVRETWLANGGPEDQVPQVWAYGEDLGALVNRENIGGDETPDWRWHISVSAKGRIPSWPELADAAHELRPGVPFAIGIPPKSWWINIHPNVLHVFEVSDENLIAQWRFERQGMEPT